MTDSANRAVCPACGSRSPEPHSPACPMLNAYHPEAERISREAQQAPQPPQPVPAAAVVQTDGSVYYAVLGAMTWDTFMFELITKGCVMTRDIFINRPSIARVQYVMLPPQPSSAEGSNVVNFPPTKGSA